jgi:hypothetical protein
VKTVPSSKKIRDLLKLEKSVREVYVESIDDEPGCLIETWALPPTGRYHREHGPAVINYYEDGTIAHCCYYIDGQIHKEDGPAWVDYDKDGSIVEECWYLNGERHRTDGPADIIYSDNKVVFAYYYLRGREYEVSDWEREVAKGSL